MVPQVVPTRKGLLASGHLAAMRSVVAMHSLHVTTKMLRSNEALFARAVIGVELVEQRADVVALLRVSEGVNGH